MFENITELRISLVCNKSCQCDQKHYLFTCEELNAVFQGEWSSALIST